MLELQQLLVDKLGRQDYTLAADVLKLSCFEHAAAQRSESALAFRMGENQHLLKAVAGPRYSGQLCISAGDGSRAARQIERLWDPEAKRAFLVGEEFPADVRKWPGLEGGQGCHPISHRLEDAFKYINLVRTRGGMSHEIHTEVLTCTSKRTLGLLAYVLFPEPSKGFTAQHHLLYWHRLMQLWHDHSIRCMGLSTDSCSTGLGAGMALMTPTASAIRAGSVFLGLSDPDFVLLAPCIGGRVMADGVHFDFFPKWYGDGPHLARTMRRNLTYETRSLIFNQLANGAERCAQMSELEQLKAAAPRGQERSFAFLTEIITINKWRDQKGDAAYAMLSAKTLTLLERWRPDTYHATYLYLLAGNYLLEPYVNPNMTNPMAATCSAYIGYGLMQLQELYVVQFLEFDADIHLASYQQRRTASAMAHTVPLHFLDIHRNSAHLMDATWSQASLRGANTFGLEGRHGQGRTLYAGRNWTPAGWCKMMTKLQRIDDRRLAVAFHGWKTRAARNVQRTDKILTLWNEPNWSLLPQTSEYSLQCGGDGWNPPEQYDDFCEDLNSAKRRGQDIALEVYEARNPSAAAQLKQANLWPKKWSDDGGGKWRPQGQMRDVAVKLVQGSNPISVDRPGGPDALEASLDDVQRKRLAKADKDSHAEREKHAQKHAEKVQPNSNTH